MTDDLVVFLWARLDEDEQVAKRVQQAYADEEFWAPAAVINAFALVDPARVLAEVQAKRELLTQFELRGASVRAVVRPATGGVWDDLIRILAIPYASHRDYRAEWAPTS